MNLKEGPLKMVILCIWLLYCLVQIMLDVQDMHLGGAFSLTIIVPHFQPLVLGTTVTIYQMELKM